MKQSGLTAAVITSLLLQLALAGPVAAADIIKDGKALGSVWIKDASPEFLKQQMDAGMALEKLGSRASRRTSDQKVAEYLVSYVEKMTGV